MASETGLDIPITATGGAAAAAEIGKTTAAVGAFDRQAKAAAASNLTLANNTQKLSAGLGAFGGALGSIDPLLGQFGASIGRAGGAIGAMTSLIGGGPGVLFGGAVAVIGLLASAWRDSAQAAEEAAKAAAAETKALEDHARAADKARVSLEGLIAIENQRTASANLQNRLRLGAGSVEEQRGYLADVERRFAESSRRDSSGNIIGSDPALRAELEQARRGLANAQTFGRVEGDIAYLNQFGGEGGASSGRGRTANDNARIDARLAQALGEGTGGRSSDDDVFNLMVGGGIDRTPGADQSGFGDFISSASSRGFGGGGLAVGGKGSGGEVKESVRHAQEVQAAWTDAGAAITDSFAGVFAALITGGEASAAAMLAALGDQMVGEGSRAVFSGLFQTALGNPMGPTMIGIGAAEIAFGATLGATMSGAQGGSSGGAARPTPGANGGGQQREQGPTVINVYALNPNAEAGKAMAKADRMRNQRKLAS